MTTSQSRRKSARAASSIRGFGCGTTTERGALAASSAPLAFASLDGDEIAVATAASLVAWRSRSNVTLSRRACDASSRGRLVFELLAFVEARRIDLAVHQLAQVGVDSETSVGRSEEHTSEL